MKKIIFITLLTLLSLDAKTIEASYKISYGIFGELGIAKTTLKTFENNTYEIKVHAYATGIAKFLSSQKEEFYESKGVIKDKLFIPNKYSEISNTSYKKRNKLFTFDYEKNIVQLKKDDKRLITKHNVNMENSQYWKETSSHEKVKFFAENDLLSLFFNVTKVIPDFNQGNSYDLKAIGANKKDGKLNITIPKDEKYQELEKILDTNNKKFIVTINQKIFSSTNGELFISLNKEGFCDKAVLKDVLIFGDIIGEMISFNIKDKEK